MNRREWCMAVGAAVPLGLARADVAAAAAAGLSNASAASAASPMAQAASPPASARHDARQRYELFNRSLQRRAAEITRAHLDDVGSLAEWTRERPRVLREFRHMLGLEPWPDRTSLQAATTGVIDRPTHRIEKVVFESLPGLYVTGNLYLPREVPGPLPTVLYVCGHSPGPHGAKIDYQHHGVWFARHGFAALLIDTIEFGELPGLHHGTHNLGMWDWLSRGYTPAGPEVWNAVRAIDYLLTRPEVDGARLAMTGISGGGAITWYTAAVDERVAVAVPVCATWTVEHQAAADSVHENCDCIYFHNTYQTDLATAGALIAPRPLKFLNAMRDEMFPPAGYHHVLRQLEPVYAWHDVPDRLALYEHDSPHRDIVPFRKEANEWIRRWLLGDATPFDEGTIEPEAGETLRVLDRYPADTTNDSIHRTFVATHQPRAWADRASWEQRRDELVGLLHDQVLRLLPSATVPFDAWTQPDRGWANRYCDVLNVEFTTEPDVRVQGQLFVPREARYRQSALVYVKRAEDVIYPVDWDLLLPMLGRCVVLTLRPRAIDYPVDNYRLTTIKRTAALLGGTLETLQLWDVLRSLDFLIGVQGLPLTAVTLYGRGAMGPLGFYAAALDPRITRVIVDDPPASHRQGPPLLNVLRVTDLPEAAALLAPRELVSLTPLPAAYDYTASIYELYGARDAMREAGALGQALRIWDA